MSMASATTKEQSPMIISSTYTFGVPQTDGRVRVFETHTADTGDQYTQSYLAQPTADFNKILAQHASMWTEVLAAEREAAARRSLGELLDGYVIAGTLSEQQRDEIMAANG